MAAPIGSDNHSLGASNVSYSMVYTGNKMATPVGNVSLYLACLSLCILGF